MLSGDRLLIMRETGELLLAAASPEAFKQIERRGFFRRRFGISRARRRDVLRAERQHAALSRSASKPAK